MTHFTVTSALLLLLSAYTPFARALEGDRDCDAQSSLKAKMLLYGKVHSDSLLFRAAKSFIEGSAPPEGIERLSLRIIDGASEELLSVMDPMESRKFVFYVNGAELRHWVGVSTEALLDWVGIPKDVVAQKKEAGHRFRLLFVDAGEAMLWGTWDNVLRRIEIDYPQVAERARRHIPSLRDAGVFGPELYQRIQALDPSRDLSTVFASYGLDPKHEITGAYLKMEDSPFNFRAWLFAQLEFWDLYAGNGYTLSNEGKRGFREYIGPNYDLKKIESAIAVELR